MNSYNYGDYGLAKKREPNPNTKRLSDLSFNPFQAAADLVKQGVDAVATKVGIDTNNAVYDTATQIGIDMAKNILEGDKTANEIADLKSNAKRQADLILSRFSNMDCESMSDSRKRDLAKELATHTALFAGLNMSNDLLELIKKYDIPTNCPVPPKKNVVTPALIGVGAGGATYFVAKPLVKSTMMSLLLATVVGGTAGTFAYKSMNKEVA